MKKISTFASWFSVLKMLSPFYYGMAPLPSADTIHGMFLKTTSQTKYLFIHSI